MIQILISVLIFVILVIPVGKYLYKVADNKKTLFDPIFDRLDGGIYRLCGINRQDMNWKTYAISMLTVNAALVLIGYALLRLQGILWFNPNKIAGMEASLSFNTIISFMSNTNLQHYSGESGLSYFSQMAVITMMMFTSAATGYSVCMAMIRGFCGKQLGNYFQDMVRMITRVLLPFSIIISLALVCLGVPQTLSSNATVTTIENTMQDIPLGPIASLVSIKHLGTNGGGFLGANSSTPLENPNVIANVIQMYSMMLLPAACIIVFGLMCRNRKKNSVPENLLKKRNLATVFGGEAKPVFIAMSLLFLAGVFACFFAESAGNPVLGALGLNQATGSMEGKETRFGIALSALFTTVTTAFTTGTINNMHDTLTPLGGMIPLLNMMINCIFGGVGVGLMNMLLYVLLAVFLCGLMIGRTPEYLGKKIESKEIQLTVLCIVLHPLLILGFSALALSVPAGLTGISNPGFHGLSQVLYEFSSSAANNGSGFEGLADNSVFWNVTTGLVMFFGRYASIVFQLAIAGSLLAKKEVTESAGTLKTASVSFGVVTAAIVLIFAALTFFPALALGPIAEQLTLGRFL